MTNPYTPPTSEILMQQSPIKLRGTKASSGASIALQTLSCKINPSNPVMDFSYEPASTRNITLGCFFLCLIILAVLKQEYLLGWIGFFLIYGVVILIMSRRVKFNLREEDLWIDSEKSLVGLRKLRQGQYFEMVFRAKPGDLSRLASLA